MSEGARERAATSEGARRERAATRAGRPEEWGR